MSGSVSLATNHSIKTAQLKRIPPSGRECSQGLGKKREKKGKKGKKGKEDYN